MLINSVCRPEGTLRMAGLKSSSAWVTSLALEDTGVRGTVWLHLAIKLHAARNDRRIAG